MYVKQEEIVPVADMLLTSFERDQSEIEAENGFYNTEYLNSFKAMTEEVRELERADVLLTDQKKVTKALYLLADNLYQPLRIFEIVIAKSGLDTNLVSTIIADLKSRNIEGALVNIKALMQVVSSNNDLFIAKSMKPTFPALLQTNFAAITEQSNLQTEIMKNRKLLTEGNNGSYEVLYNDYILDVCKIGKALYRSKAKAKEYTISNMLKRLHVAKPKKDDK